MTKLLKTAQAGSVESSDILIMVAPAEPAAGINVELVTPAMQQFGEQIKNVIIKACKAQGVQDAVIHANDKGALDFTIEARVTTAICRARS
jgi:citrate lyase subunit gamma (acyl carrier protein)